MNVRTHKVDDRLILRGADGYDEDSSTGTFGWISKLGSTMSDEELKTELERFAMKTPLSKRGRSQASA